MGDLFDPYIFSTVVALLDGLALGWVLGRSRRAASPPRVVPPAAADDAGCPAAACVLGLLRNPDLYESARIDAMARGRL